MKQSVIVLGAKGQLGSEFVKTFPNSEHTDIQELDITDHTKVWRVLSMLKPSLIINCAAKHEIVWCENNVDKVFKVNTYAVKNLAEVANVIGATLVHYSTNYVFGGEAGRTDMYVETDRTAPVNTYGMSKVAGEDFVRNVCEKHFIIRPATLFGKAKVTEKGDNFVDMMIRLGKERGEVKVVNDQVSSPTCAKELAEKTLELVDTKQYGTYHMVGENPCTYYDFAKKIFELSDMDVKCEAVESSYFDSNKFRPLYSPLSNQKLNDVGIEMSSWEDMLEEYLSTSK